MDALAQPNNIHDSGHWSLGIHLGCSNFRRRKQHRAQRQTDSYGNKTIPSQMVSPKAYQCNADYISHLPTISSRNERRIAATTTTTLLLLIDDNQRESKRFFINSRLFSHFSLNLLLQRSLQITLILLLTLFIQATSSQVNNNNNNNNFAISSNSLHNRNANSGHYTITQLCASRSQFPPSKRIEGGTLSASHSDTDTNCTVIFRTKSAQQHFVFRFEELKLGCDDHLVIFDGDMDYGQQSISDFSCRDNMASVKVMKTTGTFLTMRYQTDGNAKLGDGFRLVITAVFDGSMTAECPAEYALCRNHLCISRSLFCDGTNHCLDNSDETGCDEQGSRNDLPYALGLLLALVLIVLICVSVFIAFVHCRRETSFAHHHHHHQQQQYHPHQFHRALGVPIQTSSSLMFAGGQPHYQFFQPANLSPYVTPQHHLNLNMNHQLNQHQLAAAATATLPRGYSTLPLNSLAHRPVQQSAAQMAGGGGKTAANCNDLMDGTTTTTTPPLQPPGGQNGEYLMMTAYPTPGQAAGMRANFILPTSQSILPAGFRYATSAQPPPFPAQNPR